MKAGTIRGGIALFLASCAALAVLIGLTSCAGPPPPVSLPAPPKPAERIGSWGLTIALYDPALFGPEQPLAQIIREYGLPLDKGKLKKPLLLINKAQRRLELWVGRRMVKAYRVQLSVRPHGPKQRQGDKRVPEGTYFVCAHGPSAYYLGLWLDYPNAGEAQRGLEAGLIGPKEYRAITEALDKHSCPPFNTKLGGDILLHGQLPEYTEEMAKAQRAKPGTLRPGLRIGDADPSTVRELQDWTDGCVALFNPDIRELYEFIPDGAQVRIVANAAVTAPGKTRRGR